MKHTLVAVTLWMLAATFVAAQQPQPPQPAGPRDTSAPAAVTTGTATVSGRIVAADTGRPVARARVSLTGAAIAGARIALTGSSGTFEFTGLPAGRYALNAAKTGFVSIAYGQRRPLQAGTPLDIADGQALRDLEMLLPRGSAIGGRVTDDTGDSLPAATVRVARYQYQQGTRTLAIVGTAQTDDQGTYRVWGLDPGTYYVSAVARLPVVPPAGQFIDAGAARGGGPAGGRGGRGAGAAGPGPAGRGAPLLNAGGDPTEGEAYTPTYYPGVPSVDAARPVVVGLGAETLGIDFGLLLVRTGRLAGRVTRADGTAASGANVVLVPDGTGRGGGGRQNGGRTDRDGIFSLASIPPGRYILQARAGDRDAPQSGRQSVLIAEGDQVNTLMTLTPPGSITGTVRFASSAAATPNLAQVRVMAPPAEPIFGGGGVQSRVAADGSFTATNVEPGSHWIRAAAGSQTWALTSVTMNGREIIDTPIEIRGGETLTGVTLTFSDQISEVSGTLTDGRGTPLTGYTVLAFPTDSGLWRPQARQIMTTRPDQNGKYRLRGLPAGSYYLTAIDPEQQGEWYEPEFLEAHRSGAARLEIAAGDVKTQDFSLAQP